MKIKENININKYSTLSVFAKSLYKNYSYMFYNDHNKYTSKNFIYMNKQHNGKLFLLKMKQDKIKLKNIYRAYRVLDKRFPFVFNKSKQKYKRLIYSRFNIKEIINFSLITNRSRNLLRLLEHKVTHNFSSFYSAIRPISLLKKAKQKKRSFYVRNYSLYNKENKIKNIKNLFYILRYFSAKKLKSFYTKRSLLKKIKQKNNVKYKKRSKMNFNLNIKTNVKLQNHNRNRRNTFSKKLLKNLYIRRHISLYKFKIQLKAFNFLNLHKDKDNFFIVKLRKHLNSRSVNEKVRKKIRILRLIYNRIANINNKIKDLKKNARVIFYKNTRLKLNKKNLKIKKLYLKKRRKKMYHNNFRYRIRSKKRIIIKLNKVSTKLTKNKKKDKNKEIIDLQKKANAEKIKNTLESMFSPKNPVVSPNYFYNKNKHKNNYKNKFFKYKPFTSKSKKVYRKKIYKFIKSKLIILVNLLRFKRVFASKIKDHLLVLRNNYNKRKTIQNRVSVLRLKKIYKNFSKKYKSFVESYPKIRPRKFRYFLKKLKNRRRKYFVFCYSKQNARFKRFALFAPFSSIKSKVKVMKKSKKNKIKIKKLSLSLHKFVSLRKKPLRLASNSFFMRNFFLPIFSFEKQKKRFGLIKVSTRNTFSKRILLVLKKIKKIIKNRSYFRKRKNRLQNLLPFNFAKKSKSYSKFFHPAFVKNKKYHLSKKFIRFKLRKRKLKLYFKNKEKKSGEIKKELSSDYAQHIALSVTKYTTFRLKQKYKRLKKYIKKNLKNNNSNSNKKIYKKKTNIKKYINKKSNKKIINFLHKRFKINKKLYLKEKQFDKAEKFYYYNFRKILRKTTKRNLSKNKKRLHRQTSYFKSYRNRRFILLNKKNVISNYGYQYNHQKKSMEQVKIDNYATVKQPYKFGKIFIRYSANNSFMCLSDTKHRVVTKVSGGSKEFKGKKRATPYSKERLARTISTRALSLNYKIIDIILQNSQYNNDYHVRKGFSQSRLFIRKVEVHQKMPHGYVRLKKPRRI